MIAAFHAEETTLAKEHLLLLLDSTLGKFITSADEGIPRYCAFHKHANSKIQKPPSQLRFSLPSIVIRSQAMNLETQKHTKRIEIHQSQITNLDLLNPFKQSSVS